MKPVWIIAEAGVNHNGDLRIARRMVEVAAKSGANVIKFQTFKAANLASKQAQKAKYQKEDLGSDETQYKMLSNLELDKNDHLILMKIARENNINFLSSPFDIGSIDLLNELGIETFKIPSGEITNLPYLQKIGALNKKVILSTGMATLEEIKKALSVLVSEGTKKENLVVLHTNTEYPTPFEDVNLNAMITIKNTFNVAVGYSDHTSGIEASVAAVALGAEVIEKHFTLSKTMKGPDHKASLEPDELALMVTSIRNIEKALGDGIKKPSTSEIKNISVVRKSIHYSRNLKNGHVLTEGDLVMKRPGDGISPMELNKLLNRKLQLNVYADSKVKWEDLN